MKPRRRWFQYSLRSFLVVVTALAVWLGIVINQAREQREAVEAIEELGGVVRFDWQPRLIESEQLSVPHFVATPDFLPPGKPAGPDWLRRLVGDDFFQHVNQVISPPKSIYDYSVTDSDVRMWMPILKQFSGLKMLIVRGRLSDDLADSLKAELPCCQVIHERGFLDSAR